MGLPESQVSHRWKPENVGGGGVERPDWNSSRDFRRLRVRNGKERKVSEGQVSHRWEPENVGVEELKGEELGQF